MPSEPRNDTEHDAATLCARRWRVGGQVQGVGFRPFVYRLAHQHRLSGWVRNCVGEVEIVAEGSPAQLDAFATDLIDGAPPLAKPHLLSCSNTTPQAFDSFEIQPSTASDRPQVHLPPDYFACKDCITDINMSGDRRYRYPFTNCTQCGPRYTLITALPYDRPNTAMAAFPLCDACQQEYRDPLDRRFHAEPTACPVCGPHLRFHSPNEMPVEGNEAALCATVAALAAGRIIAIKGVGGYHLACDASDDAAVARLRQRKPRPHKPLAVMFPETGADGCEVLDRYVAFSAAERALVTGPSRPIVLAGISPDQALSPELAPGLAELGVMLPYSPLHHLLLADYGKPLVMTSGNISGEPVLTDPAAAQARLAPIADAFLHHNRPIVRPADDSVFRTIGNRPRPLRLGRGYAPLELTLPQPVAIPTLAVGAHLKGTITLAWDQRCVISPHIGDMGTRRSLDVFNQVIADLQRLYQVKAERVVCDRHPDYASSRWAHASTMPVTTVQHHRAHASALVGEIASPGPWLVFSWDGTGLGDDGTLWGGEAFYGAPGQWQRVASFRPFRLPGGDQAGRQPWRTAIALNWEAGMDWQPDVEHIDLLRQAWEKHINCPRSSAVGRLFDAAAAMLGVTTEASFEGQGPMYLEALATGAANPIPLPLREDNGLWRSDWAPLLCHLRDSGRTIPERSACLHASFAQALCDQVSKIADQHPVTQVGLCGGVFQNANLVKRVTDKLQQAGYSVQLPATLPVNDAAISFGQIIETAAQDNDS